MHYTFIHLINIYQVPTCAIRYWVYRRESGIFLSWSYEDYILQGKQTIHKWILYWPSLMGKLRWQSTCNLNIASKWQARICIKQATWFKGFAPSLYIHTYWYTQTLLPPYVSPSKSPTNTFPKLQILAPAWARYTFFSSVLQCNFLD